LELLEMPLRIGRTAQPCRGHPDDLVEVPMLLPDHYGCGLGCARFTGTLAAVEEHERDALVGFIISFPKIYNATFSAAMKTS